MKLKLIIAKLTAFSICLGSIAGYVYAQDTQTSQPMMQTAKQTTNDAKAAGDAFLASNKTKPGVVTTTSGLQYKVIKEGTGDMHPASNSVVVINYAGKLLDGREFDSSKGTPVEFPVNNLVPGFSEALKLMKKGSVYEVYIPSSLAYGESGVPNSIIGPNQTLIFTIELLDIK